MCAFKVPNHLQNSGSDGTSIINLRNKKAMTSSDLQLTDLLEKENKRLTKLDNYFSIHLKNYLEHPQIDLILEKEQDRVRAQEELSLNLLQEENSRFIANLSFLYNQLFLPKQGKNNKVT